MMYLYAYALVLLLTRTELSYTPVSGFREAFLSLPPLEHGGRSLKGGVPITSPLALLRPVDPTEA